MPRAALVVGIDHYHQYPDLLGCQLDARRIGGLLTEGVQSDGSRTANMEVTSRLSGQHQITADSLLNDIEQLVQSEIECAVFYFAGHSALLSKAKGVCLMTPEINSPGIRMSEVFEVINSEERKALSVVVILDTCHAGAAGEDKSISGLAGASSIGRGVTILASSDRAQSSNEDVNGGCFRT